MLKIGLTGGIGSGKTTVAKMFEVLGIPVYNADKEAKLLMNNHPPLKSKLKKYFGKAIYEKGKLNTGLLASIVFNDAKKLAMLNSLVHPVSLRHAALWIKKQTAPYIIKEAALLFEANATESLDWIIGVAATKKIRLKRVMERDGCRKEEVEKRISRQMDEKEKLRRCHFVIHNNEKELLTPQIVKLHQLFLEKSTA